jgi:Na+-driven multidrug efflux pump
MSSPSTHESDPLLLPVVTTDGFTNKEEENCDNNGDDNDHDDDHHHASSSSSYASLWSDAKDTVRLGIPIFLATLSWVGMKTTDSALLGHVSPDALAAAALSDLWTMCTQMLVQAPVLGVLIGAAVGAGNPKLGGIYLQVSIIVLSCVAIFVFICWNLTGLVWTWFGSDPKIASMAGYYARYVLCNVLL